MEEENSFNQQNDPIKPEKKYLPKKIWIPVFFAAIILAVLFVWRNVDKEVQLNSDLTSNYYDLPDDSEATLDKAEVAGWQTYRNEEFGFEVMYPSGSSFEETEGLNRRTFRSQNYVASNDLYALAPGEYYLEIFAEKSDLDNEIRSCSNRVLDGEKISFGEFQGIRGLGEPGGDAGGFRFALCVESQESRIYVQATENDEEGTLANQILSTFEFTDADMQNEPEEDSPDIVTGDPALVDYFTGQLRQKVVEEIGQPIEGFEPNMFLQVYPGLTTPDFDGVQAFNGVYREVSGELQFEGTLTNSAGQAISSQGMQTLLDNISQRLNIEIDTQAAIDQLILQLEK